MGKRYGAGDCSGLVLSGVSSRVFSSVYWGMAFREVAFVSSLLVVVEICFMGSVARGNEAGLSVARQEEVGIVWVWGNGSSFLRYLVLLFSYCLKQFVYMLIKRNESHSERV